MRKLIWTLFLTVLPFVCMAQTDEKYLAGAVPEENGRVIFTKKIAVPLNANEIYEAVKEWAAETYKPDKEFPNNRILSENPEALEVTIGGEEYIVFSSKAWALDRTRVYYKLNIACSDNQCTARIFNIKYWYEEERNGGQRFKAEEWITDEMGLNKSKSKLARMSGKFRRKTIDHVEEIFNNLETFVNKKGIKSAMK